MKKLLALVTIGASLTPMASVLASDGSQGTSPTAPTGADTQAMCEKRVEMSKTRLANIETRHTENSKKLDAAISRLQEFIDKAAAKDVDTSKIAADLKLLETYAAQIETDYTAVHSHLYNLTTVDCSATTNDNWQADIEEAKSLFATLKANVANIRSLKATIKADIDALLSSLRLNTPITPNTEQSPS